MKKEKKVFALALFGVLMISFLVGAISAAEGDASGFYDSDAYKNFIKPWFVPEFEKVFAKSPVLESVFPNEGINETAALIIGLITTILLGMIFYDLITLIPVFNEWLMRLIAIGLTVIMILFKWNVTLASTILVVGTNLFAWAGSIALGIIIIIAIIVLISLLFGFQKIAGWLDRIRSTRETLTDTRRARRKGGKAAAFTEASEEFAKGTGI